MNLDDGFERCPAYNALLNLGLVVMGMNDPITTGEYPLILSYYLSTAPMNTLNPEIEAS